jgi:hypothetical protein
MNNPMFKQLNKTNPGMQGIKNLYNTLCSAGNPHMMLNQMMAQNPQIKQAMDYVNANGGDARAAFYKLCQEKGVDPSEILNHLN